MTEPFEPEKDVPHLAFLRRLVTVLSFTMIAGMVMLIALFVIRFQDSGIDLPKAITLPDGKRPVAFTQTRSWYAVVSADDQILIFNLKGELVQTVPVKVP